MARPGDFFGDRRGAAAVEFALVGTLFIMTTLFVLMAGTILYINQAVDYAASMATRDIMTGTAQNNGATLGTFTNKVCSRLPPGIQCSNLIIQLRVVLPGTEPGGYYTFVRADRGGLSIPALSPGAGEFTLGAQGDYQYLQVIYPITFLPTVFATMLSGGATYNGQPAYLAIATAAFRNEQY